jgi:hypothetical protein
MKTIELTEFGGPEVLEIVELPNLSRNAAEFESTFTPGR